MLFPFHWPDAEDDKILLDGELQNRRIHLKTMWIKAPQRLEIPTLIDMQGRNKIVLRKAIEVCYSNHHYPN